MGTISPGNSISGPGSSTSTSGSYVICLRRICELASYLKCISWILSAARAPVRVQVRGDIPGGRPCRYWSQRRDQRAQMLLIGYQSRFAAMRADASRIKPPRSLLCTSPCVNALHFSMSPFTSYLVASLATTAAASSLVEVRQENSNSNCSVFGIDFVDGGSYFINSNSTNDFTAVQQFEGCNNDTASILLVQQSTEDEWECSSVPAGQLINLLHSQLRSCTDHSYSTRQHLAAFNMPSREGPDGIRELDDTRDWQ